MYNKKEQFLFLKENLMWINNNWKILKIIIINRKIYPLLILKFIFYETKS